MDLNNRETCSIKDNFVTILIPSIKPCDSRIAEYLFYQDRSQVTQNHQPWYIAP